MFDMLNRKKYFIAILFYLLAISVIVYLFFWDYYLLSLHYLKVGRVAVYFLGLTTCAFFLMDPLLSIFISYFPQYVSTIQSLVQ